MKAARYPHRVTVTRRPAGTSAGAMVNGVWVAAWYDTTVSIYDGIADAQDGAKTLQRGGDGTPVVMSDATVFVPETVDVAAIQLQDLVTVTWGDARAATNGRVVWTRALDASFYVKWV